MVESRRARTVPKVALCSLRTKDVADRIFKSVLYSKGFIFLICETIGKMMERAVDEYRFGNMEQRSKKVAENKSSIERSHLHATCPSKTPSDLELHEEPRRSPSRGRNSFRRNCP